MAHKRFVTKSKERPPQCDLSKVKPIPLTDKEKGKESKTIKITFTGTIIITG